jgi:hypothetical protein
MSNTYDVAFVNQYSGNVQILEQQKGSKLLEAVRIENQNAEYAYYEQINAVTGLTTNPSQHADTVIIDTPHVRRRVGLNYYTWAELIDEADDTKTLINATNPYAINAAYKMGRQKDIDVLTAAAASADTGKTGQTPVTFDGDMVISASGTYGGSTGGMNVDKLRGAKLKLDNNDVDTSDRFCIHGPQQLYDLLGSTQITSSDYANVKALVQGDVDTFMGFKFIMTTETILIGDTRACYVWHKDAMLLAIGIEQKGFKARIEERADKNYSTQVFNSMQVGATRMNELAICKIECVEV